jgi:hypothetical protein
VFSVLCGRETKYPVDISYILILSNIPVSLCLAVDMRRQYVSNFTGSAGTAIVTHDQVTLVFFPAEIFVLAAMFRIRFHLIRRIQHFRLNSY